MGVGERERHGLFATCINKVRDYANESLYCKEIKRIGTAS
jgi:hypothetical protein